MLEHSRIDNIQKNNSLEESRISVHGNMESENSFMDHSMLSGLEEQDDRQHKENEVHLTEIESLIISILDDNKRMARFGKVKAAAALYNQATTEKEKINSLSAIRDSAAYYLIERKRSSDLARKTMCERLILKIDAYAAANAISLEHSTSYMLDGRHMTYEEIDNEIRIAHSLTGAGPLSEVTKERRDNFRKKIQDVKLANSYKADIEKWKSSKRAFLDQQKQQLGIGQSVNEGFDAICIDTILWYGRAYNRTDEAMATMYSRLKIDDDKGNLPARIKARQIEIILADIMSWNMNDFTFGKTDDFLHRRDKGESQKEHFMKLYSKLQLAKNADILLGEVLRMHNDSVCDTPLDFSEKTLEEMKDRLKIYKEIEKDYSERLSIMSSPYYALLQQSDIESAMTEKSDAKLIAMKQEKEIPGTRIKKKVPPEFTDYIDKLQAKKKRWDTTKISDYFTRNTKIEKSLDGLLERKGIKVEERKNRFVRERDALDSIFARDLSEFKQEEIEGFRSELKEHIVKEAPEVERRNIDASMRAVQGRSFVPVEKPAGRMGFWGTLKNYGLSGARWMVGATVGKVGTVVGMFLGMSGQLQEKEKVKAAQKKRIHGIVPGTKDEKFADEHITDSDDEQNILYDIRRAPLVWEKLTAGDPDDPPEVTIMSKQSIVGSRATDPYGGMGHAMIGLAYSRFNKATGRKERYNLRIGFHPGGGAQKMANHVMMTANALMQGQVRDDSDFVYHIARKYTVKPGDINRILRAAETYADGGYGYYTRNCTTFVVDMAKLANIPIADETGQDAISFQGLVSNSANVLMGGANSAYYLAANNIADKFQTKDKSYQNYGQKLTTKEDLDRYYDTAQNNTLIKKGYSPGALGEDLREDKKGELSAFNGESQEVPEFDDMGEVERFGSDFQKRLENAGEELAAKIKERLREQNLLQEEDEQSLEFLKDGVILTDVLGKNGNQIPGKVKDKHRVIREKMKAINKFYAEKLKNDSLLNEPLMKYLSLCEATLNFLDNAYRENISYEYQSEMGGLFENYETDETIKLKRVGNPEIKISISPELYYGYVKLGKSGPQIVRDYNELQELSQLSSAEKTDEQSKRQNALYREYRTACDFGRAGRFNLYKDEYGSKDIEYAFKTLPDAEMQTESGEQLEGDFFTFHSPSCIQQAVIMGKVINGIDTINFNYLHSNDAVIADIDNHLKAKLLGNESTIKSIVTSYIDGKEEQSSDALALKLLNSPIAACVNSALKKLNFSSGRRNIISYHMGNMTQTRELLTNIIDGVRRV
ncbi:MAG: hypothetical protein II842_15270 [Butyrivibrio sp.]|nr:hypothetical protein [Butyrivibrio sp.]